MLRNSGHRRLYASAIAHALFALSLWGVAAHLIAAQDRIPDPQTIGVPRANAPEVPGSDPVLASAKMLAETGQLKEAEQTARAFLRAQPNSADGHFLLGYILFRQSAARASLAEYTEGARYRVPSTSDLKIVAEDYVVLGDFVDADNWFTRALEWDPNDVQAWYYLGRTKYNENRFEEAIKCFQHCLKLDPRNVKAEDNLGLAYAGLGRTDEAIAAYNNAIDWQAGQPSKNAQPFINLGTLLVEQNQPKRAIPLLTQAINISPADAKAHQQLGNAYFHLDRLQDAQSELEKAVELSPDDGPLHYMLGQVYRKAGLAEKAKLQFSRYSVLIGSHSTPEVPASASESH